MRFTLDQYLNQFSWSQAECAREADVSTSVVARVLKGQRISRRNAEKLIRAIDAKLKAQGQKERVTLDGIEGLNIAELRRKRPAKPPEPEPGM